MIDKQNTSITYQVRDADHLLSVTIDLVPQPMATITVDGERVFGWAQA